MKQDAPLPQKGYLTRSGYTFHYWLPTTFHAASANELQDKWKEVATQVKTSLQCAEVVVITLGTAAHYRHKELGFVVANNHKQPAEVFERKVEDLLPLVKNLRIIKEFLAPQARLILTVSPVRHIRDGLTESCYSKSILRVAAQQLLDEDERVHYFSAYELMLDELRDYRWYKDDGIHPSPTAAQYIADAWCKVWLTPSTLDIMSSWRKVLQLREHKPMLKQGEEYERYLQALKGALKREWPFDLV